MNKNHTAVFAIFLLAVLVLASCTSVSVPDAEQQIAELEETNGGCEYPCFWGITPWETSWDEVYEILHPFSESMVSQKVDNFHTQYLINLADDTLSENSQHPDIRILMSNDVVESIQVWRSLLLFDVLQHYGRPEGVYYDSFFTDDGPPRFQLVLFYRTQGMIITLNDQSHGDYIFEEGAFHARVCGREIGGDDATMIFYDPQNTVHMNEFLAELITGDDRSQDIDWEMGMTAEYLYETFLNQQTSECLIDPSGLSEEGMIDPYAPTNSIYRAQNQIAELLLTNGYCDYPCFWGITPGITSIFRARLILDPMTRYIPDNTDNLHNLTWQVDLDDYPDEDEDSRFYDIELLVTNDIVQEIRYDPGTVTISDVLLEFGTPEEVFYYLSDVSYPLFEKSIELILIYPSRGIIVHLLFAAEIQTDTENGTNRNSLWTV